MIARKTTWTLHVGNALHELAKIDAESVDCLVTSPPYWGLRDYGDPGQEWPDVTYSPIPGCEVTIPAMVAPLGQEPEPTQFIGHLVLVFREVRRVLKPSGTLWLNLGDSYASSIKGSGGPPSTGLGVSKAGRVCTTDNQRYAPARFRPDAKPKDLCGIPWLAAFALRSDGWYLRSEVIWAKPNPMPESVTDRPTKAHEQMFLLTKSPRYFYDADAVREPMISGANGSSFTSGTTHAAAAARAPVSQRVQVESELGRNARTVWTVASQPYAGAHFATMPPALVEPAVKAGCPAGGLVLDPFTGSGTVGAVALSLGRSFVGTELSPEYAKLATERLTDAAERAGLIDADSAMKATRPVQLGIFGAMA